MSEPSDWELLRRSAGDDSRSYDALVRRHHRAATAFCRQVLGDHHRAEDVVQRVFLNIYRTRARHEERARFKTFLFRALLNLCLNELERRPEPASWADAAGEDVDWIAAAAPDRRAIDPSAAVERDELRAAIDRGVLLLNPKHRAALYLRDFEGLAYEQIATVLEASLSEVKIWIHRGRKRLAALLRPYLERGEFPA